MSLDKYLESNFTDTPLETILNRRDFLKMTGGGILILFSLRDISFAQGSHSLPDDFNAFLHIDEHGSVTCFTGKIEMGQGIITSLAQMLADELDVSLDSVEMVMGDTDLCPYDRGTFGSMSTRFFGPPLRQAAAEARRVLITLASEKMHIPEKQLATDDGTIYSQKNSEQRVTYAQLTKGQKIRRHLTEPVSVKSPKEFEIMGQPVNRRDAHEKVTGNAQYAGDIQVSGMVYASILRPPSHAAKLKSVDLSDAKGVDGLQIVRDGDFIAVLHKYPDVAMDARDKIQAEWDVPKSSLNEKTIFDHLLEAAPPGNTIASGGNLETGERDAESVIEQTYLDGYVAHAPMEPHTAVVQFDGTSAKVWASTQTPFSAKEEAARELGIPADNVRVITPFVGGGFGGKTRNLQVQEAAKIAKLSGKPVQVAWSRSDEFFEDSFRPAAVVKVKGGLDDTGKISLWDYNVYFAGERGASQFYNIPNHRTKSYGGGWGGVPGAHPFATGAWRAPANNTNTFARESHVDMLAASVDIDPVEFRLQNLSDARMKRVINTAADNFGWKPTKSSPNTGFGIACGTDAGTYVATMAEVEVDRKSGQVQVKRVLCTQDMGICINPEGATIQMEGCITMGMGYALSEDVRFKGGDILDKNFGTYELPKFSWLPKIETVILDHQELDPQGGGEPAIITMGAVIANAIYDAVGARVVQLPMTPERVKAALGS